MNYEIVDYDEGIPVKVFTVKLNVCPLHWHDELEIVYVLEGKVKVVVYENACFLEKGDISLVGFKEIHQIYSLEGEAFLQIIQINPKVIEYYFSDLAHIKFLNNPLEISKEMNADIRLSLKQLISEIVENLVRKKRGYEFQVMAVIYKIFGIIIEKFPYTIRNEVEASENNIVFKRLTKIIEYIEKNYMNEVNINNLAQIIHLNRYYLSHFFKEHTGISIGQYVTNFRMNKATELIVKNEDSITNIVLLCGFKNIKHFYKIFKKIYNCSPLEYKSKNRREISSKRVYESELYK